MMCIYKHYGMVRPCYLFLLWNVLLTCLAFCLTIVMAACFLHLCTCLTCLSVHASSLHPSLSHHHLCYVDVYCVSWLTFFRVCHVFSPVLFVVYVWMYFILNNFCMFMCLFYYEMLLLSIVCLAFFSKTSKIKICELNFFKLRQFEYFAMIFNSFMFMSCQITFEKIHQTLSVVSKKP